MPRTMVYPIRGMYLDAIDRASHHIYLTHAYFIPDEDMLSALVRAARRGVDVRIIIPAESNRVSPTGCPAGSTTACSGLGCG